MFKKYIEFILKNAKEQKNLQKIIYINDKLLNKLGNNKHNKNLVGGTEKFDNLIKQISENIDKIIETQNNQAEQLDAVTKYIDLLYASTNNVDLKTVSDQLSDIQEIIGKRLGQPTTPTIATTRVRAQEPAPIIVDPDTI